MPTVVIIGKGPAGISAAIYTSRANVDTIVIGRDEGALAKASKIENYYGFEKPIEGRQLVNQGISQRRMPARRSLTTRSSGFRMTAGLL